jgi:hypothetical protein
MGVAVALEDKARRGPVGRAMDLSREPDLTGAAANSVRLRSRRFRQRRQGAAELDHVAIAVLPVIQELEVREDVLERHGSCISCATGDTTSTAPASAPSPDIAVARCGPKVFLIPGSYHAIIVTLSPNNVLHASLTEAQLILAQATA